MRQRLLVVFIFFLLGMPSNATRLLSQEKADQELSTKARVALQKASQFFQDRVAVHGGYVYQVSADLRFREGEGDAGSDAVWVQPPGTPAVGFAYLQAFKRTQEPVLLQGAKSVAHCLVQGQLHSGGWQNHIDFDPDLRKKLAYRVDPNPSKKARNLSSFDDDQTQSAIRFLCEYDAATRFQETSVHECVLFALDSVLKSQFPNGAWAQVFEKPASAKDSKPTKANYPSDWPRKYPGEDYWQYYTLNDNAMARTIQTLWLAHEVYRDDRYRTAAVRAADFFLLAQMPDPQPAWAQQYHFEMYPVWARKFEPPAISGGESQTVIEALLDTYARTGEKRYIATLDNAIEYLERSALPNGKLARFYELKTNRPLYFTKTYELTYSDDDMPTHYGFQVPSNLSKLKKRLEKWRDLSPSKLKEVIVGRDGIETPPTDQEVQQVLKSLGSDGAWVENGKLRYVKTKEHDGRVIRSETFMRNLEILSRYLAHSK